LTYLSEIVQKPPWGVNYPTSVAVVTVKSECVFWISRVINALLGIDTGESTLKLVNIIFILKTADSVYRPTRY